MGLAVDRAERDPGDGRVVGDECNVVDDRVVLPRRRDGPLGDRVIVQPELHRERAAPAYHHRPRAIGGGGRGAQLGATDDRDLDIAEADAVPIDHPTAQRGGPVGVECIEVESRLGRIRAGIQELERADEIAPEHHRAVGVGIGIRVGIGVRIGIGVRVGIRVGIGIGVRIRVGVRSRRSGEPGDVDRQIDVARHEQADPAGLVERHDHFVCTVHFADEVQARRLRLLLVARERRDVPLLQRRHRGQVDHRRGRIVRDADAAGHVEFEDAAGGAAPDPRELSVVGPGLVRSRVEQPRRCGQRAVGRRLRHAARYVDGDVHRLRRVHTDLARAAQTREYFVAAVDAGDEVQARRRGSVLAAWIDGEKPPTLRAHSGDVRVHGRRISVDGGTAGDRHPKRVAGPEATRGRHATVVRLPVWSCVGEAHGSDRSIWRSRVEVAGNVDREMGGRRCVDTDVSARVERRDHFVAEVGCRRIVQARCKRPVSAGEHGEEAASSGPDGRDIENGGRGVVTDEGTSRDRISLGRTAGDRPATRIPVVDGAGRARSRVDEARRRRRNPRRTVRCGGCWRARHDQ